MGLNLYSLLMFDVIFCKSMSNLSVMSKLHCYYPSSSNSSQAYIVSLSAARITEQEMSSNSWFAILKLQLSPTSHMSDSDSIWVKLAWPK